MKRIINCAYYWFPLWKWDYERYLFAEREFLTPLTLLSTPVEVRRRWRSPWCCCVISLEWALYLARCSCICFKGARCIVGVNIEGITTWFLRKSSPTFLALFCICGDNATRCTLFGGFSCAACCSVPIPWCELYQTIAYRLEVVVEERKSPELHCYIVAYFKQQHQLRSFGSLSNDWKPLHSWLWLLIAER